ncbi:Fic/DOC family protein [Micromonospora sp. NPDC004704]
MHDPYCWPGTSCLKNVLGIRDAEQLALLEARLVSVRDVEIARKTIPGDFNLEHLKAFHRALFGDLYERAGETRTVDITKADSRFCHWR